MFEYIQNIWGIFHSAIISDNNSNADKRTVIKEKLIITIYIYITNHWLGKVFKLKPNSTSIHYLDQMLSFISFIQPIFHLGLDLIDCNLTIIISLLILSKLFCNTFFCFDCKLAQAKKLSIQILHVKPSKQWSHCQLFFTFITLLWYSFSPLFQGLLINYKITEYSNQ